LSSPKVQNFGKVEGSLFINWTKYGSFDVFFVIFHWATFKEVERVIDHSCQHANV
jgi:hypothetical protein